MISYTYSFINNYYQSLDNKTLDAKEELGNLDHQIRLVRT